MDNSQSELTNKIRSAIKKKLIEINAFVDDELPDYIMILVANKRSKSHMEKDLTLFLGKDTTEFTTWLWELVNNLKGNSKTKQNGKMMRSDEETLKKHNSEEEIDVLDYDLGEQEDDLDHDDYTLESGPLFTELCEASKPNEVQNIPTSENVVTKNTDDKNTIPKAEVCPVQPVLRVLPSSTLKPVSQKVNHKNDYNPMKSEFTGSVSSVVRISQRKYARPALRANKLLLRAVDDATKSVLDGKSINEYYKPTPIKILANKKVNNSSPLHNISGTNLDARLDLNSEVNLDYLEPSDYDENSMDTNVNLLGNRHNISSQATQTNQTLRFPALNMDSIMYGQSSSIGEQKSDSTHFIVTLDGVDSSFLKRKYSGFSDESMDVDAEGVFSTNVKVDTKTPVRVKKPKIVERCKYWPACKNSDNCVYHHPTVPCKGFPGCKYGDKCLYIHPNCKFDSLCTRKDCPFTHASKRNFQMQAVPVKVPKSKIICKYYPKCTIKNCSFIHPKLCRYGAKCRLPVCVYSHFNIPSRSQLKWKADTSLNL